MPRALPQKNWLLPLILLTAATVFFRWAGIASWAMIAAAALGGPLQFRLNRRWISVLLIVATVLIVFRICTRYVTDPAHLAVYNASVAANGTARSASKHSIGSDAKTTTQAALPANAKSTLSARAPAALPKSLPPKGAAALPIAISDSGDSMLVPSRALQAGEWLSNLLCAPVELAKISRLHSAIINGVGWVLWLSFFVWAVHRAKRGDWLWLGALAYCTIVILRWGRVVPRYMVPVAPLLLIGIWNGMEIACQKFPRLSGAFLARGLMAAILVPNCMMLGTDIYIGRCDQFGERYYAGYGMKLVQASEFLREQNISPGEVAVSARYVNLAQDRSNTYAERQLNLLVGRATKYVPAGLCTPVPDKRLIRWAHRNKVRYYLYRTAVSPWRVWHFRMPRLQAWLTGKPVEQQPDWILYELKDGKATQVELPTHVAWPTTLPETVHR